MQADVLKVFKEKCEELGIQFNETRLGDIAKLFAVVKARMDKLDDGILTRSHQEHSLGGQWDLHCDGMPCVSRTPHEIYTILMTLSLLKGVLFALYSQAGSLLWPEIFMTHHIIAPGWLLSHGFHTSHICKAAKFGSNRSGYHLAAGSASSRYNVRRLLSTWSSALNKNISISVRRLISGSVSASISIHSFDLRQLGLNHI